MAAKLAFDGIIDPSIDEATITKQVDELASEAKAIAGVGASDVDKLKAVRQVLYDAGLWNRNRPFSYDHEDPLGLNVHNKLLPTYLATRRGNCVSMPVLHIILAEKLGLNVHLSTAPLHMFVRFTNPQNQHGLSIEPTSGGYPTRDIWYRENLPMSDMAVKQGLYLRTLTKRETIAHMATTVMEYLMVKGRHQEAIAVGSAILDNYPRDGYTMVKMGSAAAEIMQRDFIQKYPRGVPPNETAEYQRWQELNELTFSKAISLGWEPANLQKSAAK
ncbi:MAG: transglutaminase family protein [Sphingorhabdus sp.]